MRYASFVVLLVSLVSLGGACGSGNENMGDDGPPADAAPDAPGPGCWGLSPRTPGAEAFVGPTGMMNRITQLIDGATQSLDVQMYLFTVTSIADRIIAAKNRGVAVRVILDPDHAGNANVRTKLTSASVPTRNAPMLYSFSHAKYLLVDNKTAVIMSMNFNVDAFSSERNYGMITRDPDDVLDTKAIFDMDWAAAGGEAAKPADLACTRLVVSPNNAKQRITDFIKSATTKLDVEAMYIAEDGVRAAIVDAKKRGVNVRVILETGSDTAEVRALFMANGITVKSPVGYLLHAKLLIADGAAFVGSENFSITALTKNRELGGFVFEPPALAVIQQQFDADWAAN
jgi:phosphatidylserine/phosphatidylglycerophosphate/cardiolipin synthase-like enzyme